MIDPVDYFCDRSENICHQVINIDGEMVSVVSDEDHVTPEAARYLGRKVDHLLNQVIK